MRKGLYFRLAADNLRKNARLYLPYLLSGVLVVGLFYIILFLANNAGLESSIGGSNLSVLLGFGAVVIAIFALIFLFYTNSFLIRRRKRELGLYNVLGMEKRHLGRMMAAEALYLGCISVVGGLLFGILFSRLMVKLLGLLMGLPVYVTGNVSPLAVLVTVLYFFGVYFLTLLTNLRQVHLAKPVELLVSSAEGEREPRTKWLLAVIGVLCLGGGYYLAITTTEPLKALALFFVAVVLVVIGTYCLFTAGSIAILKLLRRNKRYYYKPKHFTAVSGMLYRMKKNAVGLANICILSTMVLVMLSTTLSLYIGLDDSVTAAFPSAVALRCYNLSSEESDKLLAAADEKFDVPEASDYVRARYVTRNFDRTDEGYTFGGGEDNTTIGVLTCAKYYLENTGTELQLEADEICVSAGAAAVGDTLVIGTQSFRVAGNCADFDLMDHDNYIGGTLLTFVFAEEAVVRELLLSRYTELLTNDDPSDDPYVDYLQNGSFWSLYVGEELDLSNTEQVAFAQELAEYVDLAMGHGEDESAYYSIYTVSRAENMNTYCTTYGGLFFLGIFLGLCFTIATILIMYYKQVTEGYEDRERFLILRKVGMSEADVKATIRSQVLTVFFLPLIVAAIHIAFAFPMIVRMLHILALTNVGLFAICTLGSLAVFSLLYIVLYALTAKAYYRIVK